MTNNDLFQFGDFTLSSGLTSRMKIECDVLSDAEIEGMAELLASRLPQFSCVEGVPTGGLRLANALKKYALTCPHHPLLIVDDVLTTGASMEKKRAGRRAIGAVLFSRTTDWPDWVTPLFVMWNPRKPSRGE